MNILNVKQWEITDPIPTEETIDRNFIKDYKNLKLDYTFVNYNLTESINKIGIDETQIVINQIVEKYDPKNLIWTCQHISVNNLSFWGGKVFTPHATKKNKHHCIPHFPVNVAKFTPIKDKNRLLSFRGSFDTHPVRSILKEVLEDHRDDIIDTGTWHFHNDSLENNQELYLEDLKNSKIILCPRGTGPSTIRLWEALASGCVPLVVSNEYSFPLENIINWKEICIIVNEEHTPVLNHYLKKFNDDRLNKMQLKGQNVFKEWFHPEKMHKILKYHLTK